MNEKIGGSGKPGTESKPFEYKYTHFKQDSIGTDESFRQTKPSAMNLSSPSSIDTRSKMKNLKNSSRVSSNTGIMAYGSPKRPLHIIEENLLSPGSGNTTVGHVSKN